MGGLWSSGHVVSFILFSEVIEVVGVFTIKYNIKSSVPSNTPPNKK